MDIHLPLTTAIAAGVCPKGKGQPEHPDGTFQHLLSQAAAKPDKVADAAKQFEALIVGQVLKTAREASNGGWLGTGEDQTGALALEVAEQGFAQALAARGALGIAKMVTPILRRDAAKVSSFEPGNPGLPARLSKGSDR